jgi:hypothetical protein
MRHPYLPLVCCLALLAGCSTLQDPGAPPDPSLFEATAMRIHPIFSGPKDWNSDGKPDGIEVLLEFQDRFSDPTKAAGTVMFELYDFRAAHPDPRGARLANPWIGSITTLNEQSARWNRTSRTYTFQLAYPQVDESHNYVLTANFNDNNGQRFFDRVVFARQQEEPAPELPPAPSTPSTPSPAVGTP